MDFRLRNRARLRRKDIEALGERLRTELGLASTLRSEDPWEEAEGPDRRYLLLSNEILGFYEGDVPFLTPRGLLAYKAEKRFVTVDMGAVRFVTNGADVMGPGITAADPGIRADDLVWVREERHGKPLACGVALADGTLLATKPKGKQVRSVTYVGDRVWTFGEEEEADEAAPADAAAKDDG